MQLSDRKYKMFFDNEGIRDAFVGLACERLELGKPDLESVEVLTLVRDVEVWGRLLETVQDQCWRFRTQQEDGVLLACEVQSSAEYLILMRPGQRRQFLTRFLADCKWLQRTAPGHGLFSLRRMDGENPTASSSLCPYT